MQKELNFKGILATGRSKLEAANRYTLAAMGKGAVLHTSESGDVSYITHASLAQDSFNPMTGNMDILEDKEGLAQVEFSSESADNPSAYHAECASGCGTHLVFDDPGLVNYCPHCTSKLSLSTADLENEDDVEEVETTEDADLELEEDEDENASESSGVVRRRKIAVAGDEEDGVEESTDEDDDSEDGEGEDTDVDAEDSADEEGDDTEEDEDGEDDTSNLPVVVAGADREEAVELYLQRTGSLSSDNKEIEYCVCSECDAHIISESSDLDGCPKCGGELQEPSLSGDDEEETESETEDMGDEENEGDDVDLTADDEETSESNEDEESEEQEEGDGNSLSIVEDSDEGNDAEEDEEETLEVESSAFNQIDDDANVQALDVSYSSSIQGQGAWTAFYKGSPVAIATASDATDKGVFATSTFGRAAMIACASGGIRAGLTETGFKPFTHRLSVSAHVEEQVQARLKEEISKVEASEDQRSKDFMAALATAAVGINKGFWKGSQNPLKAALWEALSSIGVANPEVLIDNAFRESGDAYHKMLLDKAAEINDKPGDVKEALASSILDMEFQSVSSGSRATSMESRLSNFGTTSVNTGSVNIESTSSETVDKAEQRRRVVSSLGK